MKVTKSYGDMQEREVLTVNAHFKNPVDVQTVDLEPPNVS